MSQEYELEGITGVEETSNLMSKIKEHVKELRARQWKMLEAEEALKRATREYEDYSRNVLPELFKLNGLDMIQLEDGSKVRVATKTTCSINKGDVDRTNVAKWLREHEGADLVKSECKVPSSQIEKMKAANVTYEEVTTMNTNSVKAWLIDQLGQNGSPAKITKEDIPHGINFFQFDEMEVIMKQD